MVAGFAVVAVLATLHSARTERASAAACWSRSEKNGWQVRAVTGCHGGWARLRYRLLAAIRATGPRTGEA